MKRNNIKILWIDDDKDTDDGRDIIASAKMNGIDLIGFDCGSKGVNELNDKYHEYEGILLDVRTKYNINDKDEEKNFGKIKTEINKLIAKRDYKPLFVLTGKAPEIEKYHGDIKKVYHKNDLLIDNEIKIWNDIKNETQNLSLSIVKDKYFDVLSFGDIIDNRRMILNLALHLNGIKVLENPFNQIRLVLDSVFIYLHKICVAPDVLITHQHSVNLAYAYNYFQNNQKKEGFGALCLDYDSRKRTGTKYIVNPKPWPSDISKLSLSLFGRGTPVQALNHLQKKVDDFENNHFQNLKDNKYFAFSYINALFALLLWLANNYKILR